MFGRKLNKGGADMLRIALTSADLVRSLDILRAAGIPIQAIEYMDEIRVAFAVSAKDLRRVEKLLQSRGDSFEIQGESGIYRIFRQLRGRKLLICGMILLLLMTIYLPDRIYFLRVEGNSRIPAREILAAAEHCGVEFGTRREQVRSEQVKNALLELLPGLQWAGINTRGCVGIISVREREMVESNVEEAGFGHIVAIRDGVITSCNATKGNLVCAPGEAVKAGQILISGYTDCGLTIRAEQAEGEIYGMTRRTLTVKTPANCEKKVPDGEEQKKISLLLGKKRIILWKDSRIWDTGCDRMYEEYYVTLPGGFALPLAVCVERFSPGALTEISCPEDQLRTRLEEMTKDYLESQMAAGSIRKGVASFHRDEHAAELTGEYVCIELIGKMQRDKIGENNVQDN